MRSTGKYRSERKLRGNNVPGKTNETLERLSKSFETPSVEQFKSSKKNLGAVRNRHDSFFTRQTPHHYRYYCVIVLPTTKAAGWFAREPNASGRRRHKTIRYRGK